MRTKYALFLLLLSLQSLSELAKKEAERRKLLDQQGIETKKIDQGDIAAKGNITLSSPPPRSKVLPSSNQSGKKPSLEKYRTELRNLDSGIRRDEERLASLRKRLEIEKDRPIKLGRGGTAGTAEASRKRLENQILDLDTRLKRLRDDRLKTYDAARRAGFLPGELKP